MPRTCPFAILALCSLIGLTACANLGSGMTEDPSKLVVKGALTYKARIALPPDSHAIVELRDASRADGPVVAKQRIDLQGRQVPIPFELRVDRAKLADGKRYAVRGGVLTEGRPAWASDPVALGGISGVVDVGTLNMTPVRTGAFASTFQCGDQQATIDYTQYSMRLTVGEETFNLRPVPAASGAKYEAIGDATTFFWSKGRNATLVVKGKSYPECTSMSDAAPPPFRATGNEPGWRLDIEGGKMTLVTDNGARRLVTAAPPVETSADSRRYVASTDAGPLVVTIFERACTDTMSGMPHPHAVDVAFGGRTLTGCGGDPVDLLKGPEWVVEDINRTGIIDNSRMTLDFAPDGRISGRASCNMYTGRYTLTGEALTVSNTAATLRVCAPSLMQQEEKFLGVLRNVRRFDFSEDGALILRTDDSGTITARR